APRRRARRRAGVPVVLEHLADEEAGEFGRARLDRVIMACGYRLEGVVEDPPAAVGVLDGRLADDRLCALRLGCLCRSTHGCSPWSVAARGRSSRRTHRFAITNFRG